MPPTSSGGVHIEQMLNILEYFPVSKMGAGSADSLHLDPDHFDVPTKELASKAVDGRWSGISIELWREIAKD